MDTLIDLGSLRLIKIDPVAHISGLPEYWVVVDGQPVEMFLSKRNAHKRFKKYVGGME